MYLCFPISVECISRRELAGSYVDSMFKSLKNWQAVSKLAASFAFLWICMRAPRLPVFGSTSL